MPAIAPVIRQRLLCRSDLHAMEVDGERIAQWLRSEQLAYLGHIDAEDLPGGDAVYATDDAGLQIELQELLTQHGRGGVALATDDARALLEDTTAEPADAATDDAQPATEKAAKADDMISDHVVQEGLDETIDEITEAIDNLLVTTHNAPLDLRDDAPLLEGSEETDVVEVAPASSETTLDEDILVEVGPDEIEAVNAHALHEWAPESRAQRIEKIEPSQAPAEVRVTLDAQPVTDALQQILAAVRALGERQLPQTDLAPVNETIQKGIRSLQATVVKATDRSDVEQRLDGIHDALVEAIEVVRELGDLGARRRAARSAKNARRGAGSPRAWSLLESARDSAGMLLATASTLIGWTAAAWLYPTNDKLALGALVCANLVACAALLGRKPAGT
ncbi:MAG: hypothetical protein RIT24_738 [Planctomycetota bacterium]